jgi:hypothetical protein
MSRPRSVALWSGRDRARRAGQEALCGAAGVELAEVAGVAGADDDHRGVVHSRHALQRTGGGEVGDGDTA